MAIDPQTTDTVTIPQLDQLTLALETFLVGCNADGKMGNFTAQELAQFIAPYISAIGSSPFVANTGSPLPNPIEKPTAITFVGAGTFDQTTGADVVTTEELNVLFWASNLTTGTWTIGVEIPVDLTDYRKKTDPELPIYASLSSANLAILGSLRQGRIVQIGSSNNYKAYSWQGGILDSNLIEVSKLVKATGYQLPYLNEQLAGKSLDVSFAIKELFLENYDPSYDYILTSVRRNADLPTLPTGRYSIKVVKVTKGTTTTVETMEWIQYNRVEPTGLDYIKFNFLNIVIDWKLLTNPFDFAVANSLVYVLDERIGDTRSSPIITDILNRLNKTDLFKIQDTITPAGAELIDYIPFTQKAQINNSGSLIVNSELLSIVAMPSFNDYIYFTGVAATAQRKLVYLDSDKLPVTATLQTIYPNTPILINNTYPFFSMTIITPFDVTAGLKTSFKLFKNSNDIFNVTHISGIPVNSGYIPPDLSNYYTKPETNLLLDAKASSGDLDTKADKSTTYTKTEVDADFLKKADAATTYAPKTDIDTINEALSSLAGGFPDGAVSGDNTWLGKNTFAQPITGVSAVGDNDMPTFGQIKVALNRTRNAADYGVLPTNDSATNTANLQAALDGGDIELHFTQPGDYLFNDVIYIDDDTTIRSNSDVIFKRDALYGVMFANRGLLNRTRNINIVLSGFNVSANDKEYTYTSSSILYGIRGLISMIGIDDLIIEKYKCIDGGTDNWHIQVTDFDNIKIRDIIMKGHKDGIHLGRGKNFHIDGVKAAVYDDTVALNAFDYSMSNPTIGDISNGLIENIEDLVNEWDYSSNVSRILVGALTNWVSGIETRNGDGFVHNGKVYRAITNFTGIPITSTTEPTIATFTGVQTTPEAIIWKLIQNDAVYTANVDNITYRNITHDPINGRFLSVEYDGDNSIYNRSIHSSIPVSSYPIASNIRIEKLKSKYGYIDVKQDLYYSIYLSEWNNRVQAKMIDIKSTVNKGYVSIKNMNLRGLNGGVTIGAGANVMLKDNNIGDLTAFNFGVSGCRVNSNTSMTLAETSTTPFKGDEVIVNGVKKIYNGSSWISLN